jgi:hypothetical protein
VPFTPGAFLFAENFPTNPREWENRIMKSRLSLVAILVFLTSLLPIGANAADDRVFYYSKEDAVNVEGVNAYFDVTSLQVALTSTGYIQFYVLLLSDVDTDKFIGDAAVGVGINADGKTGSEYVFTTGGIDYFGSSKEDLKVFDIRGGDTVEVSNCEGKSWITEDKDAVAFEILATCIKAPTGASAIAFGDDGAITDYTPENSDEFKFKTNYMSAKVCSVKSKDTKVIFKGTQFICNQKSGKWIWVDYAPIALAKAKYLTEKAFYKCGLNTNILGAELSDKGKTLELDGVYKYLVSDAQFACVLSTVAMPSSVKSKLSMTRALDGIQNAKFGKISVDWSYHPDDGLSITFTYN